MITISEEFPEYKELLGQNPTTASKEKWEKIISLLDELKRVYRASTCAFCQTYSGCSECPLISCAGGSEWYAADAALEEAHAAAGEMKRKIQQCEE